ncbi:hypothetical protein [Nannocystis radixulma]|uniref:hypothetical protein n=1 Tax=Nannocystis radixulma TaxID=2995305 RepID=UPI00232EC6CE|nr:hypothetical protein [Nannocystis radixulma]
MLEALAVLADVDATTAADAAVQALQRHLGLAATGEITPALLSRAQAAARAVHAEAEVGAAEAAETASALYEQIAGDREREVEAARARQPPRPTCLTEEEVGASRLAEARCALEAAGHWRRAAEPAGADALALELRAASAQARARRAATAAGPWFRSAAAGHLAAGDRLQGSRALEGALKAAALLAEATVTREPMP